MDKTFVFNARTYSYNTATKQISRVTETGNVPVSSSHPSIRGILKYVEDNILTR